MRIIRCDGCRRDLSDGVVKADTDCSYSVTTKELGGIELILPDFDATKERIRFVRRDYCFSCLKKIGSGESV